MAIVGITNRTENWKTAASFGPLLGSASVHLARRLLANDDARDLLRPGDVRLELFWRPVRDWRHQERVSRQAAEKQLVESYERHFSKLAAEVAAFPGLQTPPGSYEVADRSRLASNLANTEIDIVLESPGHLFIGEAKHEMRFHSSGSLVLTHQLIREYVTVRVLLDLLGSEKRVVPFVVGNTTAELKRQEQVRFMKERYGLRPDNILEWSDIEALR